MSRHDVRETMEQIHISPEMQEEIIVNIQNRTEQGKKRTWNLKKMAAVAATVAVAAGVIGLPVRAVVSSLVQERMDSVPVEEVQDIGDMVQSQKVNADGFSREYSAGEKERNKELWQAYESGTFPEGVIVQVDSEDAVVEGALCYDRSTGIFHLPDQEMSDEELLQVIDFQHKMEYAVINSGVVTDEEKAAYRAEEERKRSIVKEAGGISGEEAVEIAERQLAADIGEKAASLELMTDRNGNGVTLMDVSDEAETGVKVESKAGVAYDVGFGNPDTHETCGYLIDAVDGSILYTWEYNGGM